MLLPTCDRHAQPSTFAGIVCLSWCENPSETSPAECPELYTGHHQLKWQCVKTLYPCSSHQNSWDLWMFIPLKMVLIGIDPYPNAQESSESWDIHG